MNKNVMIVLAGGFIIAILVAVLVQASLGGKKVDDGGEKVQVSIDGLSLEANKPAKPYNRVDLLVSGMEVEVLATSADLSKCE